MKRFVTLPLLLVAAGVAAAQQPITTIHGLPITPHTPTPPQMPISRFRPQSLTPLNEPSRITYIPSYLYVPYPQPMPQQTNLSVNVTNYSPPQEVFVLPDVYLGAYSRAYGGAYSREPQWTPAPSTGYARPVPRSVAADPSVLRTRRLAEPSDVNSLDAVVRAMYDLVSGPSIKGRDWDRFRSLFADDARLIAAVTLPGMPARAAVMSVDQYINDAGAMLQSGVFEKEIARTVEQFGRMAQVFSTYEMRYHATDEKPYQRGVNSVQLLNDGTRWWILSVYWDAERIDNPIPPKYLPPRQ